jgi:hypothetical protein
VFAYCLRNRFFTHEQHLCDFCKFEKSLHYRDRASLVSVVYGACLIRPCYRLAAQRKSCIFVYSRQFVQEAYNGVF